MKLLIAIIRPEELDAVQAIIHKEDVELMTVSEVLDCCKDLYDSMRMRANGRMAAAVAACN